MSRSTLKLSFRVAGYRLAFGSGPSLASCWLGAFELVEEGPQLAAAPARASMLAVLISPRRFITRASGVIVRSGISQLRLTLISISVLPEPLRRSRTVGGLKQIRLLFCRGI